MNKTTRTILFKGPRIVFQLDNYVHAVQLYLCNCRRNGAIHAGGIYYRDIPYPGSSCK